MADNPYVNKVVYGDQTLIDISDTTATENEILQGYTAYGASGQKLTGVASSGASNWVNGSATNSVRTTGSNEEGSSYTIGSNAVAEGYGTKASGQSSHAEGDTTTASGGHSHAEGYQTEATDSESHAEGYRTKATAGQTHAEGYGSEASSSMSHAEGYYTKASGNTSHAEGYQTIASGNYSHAEGYNTKAAGYNAHAEGNSTTASGNYSHVGGRYNKEDDSCYSKTTDTTISASKTYYTYADGLYTAVTSPTVDNIDNYYEYKPHNGIYVEIVGNGVWNSTTRQYERSNARTLDWDGNEILAGKLTVGVAGTNSLDVATIGQLPTKTSDLTNDSNFISDSAYIHTDNNYTTTEKNKLNGIAEGAEANVNANWNENDSTSASYIQNRPFYFEEDAEAVIFEEDVNFSTNYNGVLWNNFSYTFIDPIAVNTSVSLTVDDITLDTTVEIEGSTLFIGIRDPADSTRAATNHIGLGLSGSNGSAYQTTYVLALASMFSTGTHHVKLTTIADVYHKIDNNFIDLEIENGSGFISVQQKGANANGDYSSAFGGGTATGNYAHAEGNVTSASGSCSHTEGARTTASAQTAHAEGSYTTASGHTAHAEGSNTTASNTAAHAEGNFTEASGYATHAEGSGTMARGHYAHTEGNGTIANHASQHAFGEYNIADPSTAAVSNRGNYIEIVGNGTSTSARSNARTLDWSGNEVLAGKLTVGVNPTANMDVVTKQYMENQGYLTSYTETDPTVPAWAKEATKPSYTASEVGALPDTTQIPSATSDLTNDSGFITGMEILAYGKSTWADFIEVYTAKKVVYCRASSNSNPATGSQTRLAFMAYVNNADNPTEVEFQYYRSVSSHTASQQGDQVYVYKLNNKGTWTVTVREASVKVAAGTGLTGNYSGGTMTLSLNGTLPTKQVLYDSSKVSSGTLELSAAYTSFDFLVVSYLVNTDAFSRTFDCARLQENPTNAYNGDIVIYNDTTVYASTCKFTVTDSTHFAVTNSGNNVNFIAGIVKVVGVKM